MLSTIARAGLIATALVVASASAALAETSATPVTGKTTVAQTNPAPTPTPNPLSISGFVRSYYFTRQNASNNPGAQFNFGSSKYSSTGVNQATLNNAIDVHADYSFTGGGWYVGGSYFYADPFSGPCVTANSHTKGSPCVSQRPPNTNPDDTLPGFILNTFPETYVGYKAYNVSGKLGDQLFTSPWAGPYDATRLKPVAYQGVDVSYVLPEGVTLEAADMIKFENRTSNTFTSNTLLTSYPAGGGGQASNILDPGCTGGTCTGINNAGFFYSKIGYAPKGTNYSVNGYFYGVSDIVNIFWGDARYTFAQNAWKPFVALQGGWENNSGVSYIGKIRSSLIGVQVGAAVTKNVVVTAGFDSIPWQYDSIPTASLTALNWKCSNSNNQLGPTTKTVSKTLAYFLPLNAGQCFSNANGQTTIAYGGWASPYTDNYATDPIFTTSISQGTTDRRAPGTSWKLGATFTSNNKRVVMIASDAWYNYGNSLVGENTNEWTLDGTYRFSPVTTTRYKGLLFRYRYAQRSLSNTFCGASNTTCPAGAAIGSSVLGGLPLFKYNRAQVEYDF